jgi:Flp pilus assembly pilin Flp
MRRESRRDDGASLIEYALLLALIALVAIVSLQFFGRSTGNLLSRNASALEDLVVVPHDSVFVTP